jgi:deoxycytidylate deaminase
LLSAAVKEYDSDYGADKFHKYSGKTRRYMELAKHMAIQSTYPDYRHGAVLVKGSIRNVSFNKNNYCAFGSRFQREHGGRTTMHAELGAILGMARSITDGATVYVARVGREGDYKLSKPCTMCHEALKYVGIKRVVYTINNKKAGSYKL